MYWISDNYIEVFGAVAGIVYVFLEIRQNIWLWPVGIVTSAVYIWVFFISKFYADMSLQGYYLVISVLGWYWWARKGERWKAEGGRQEEERGRVGEGGNGEMDSPFEGGQGDVLKVSRINVKTTLILSAVFAVLFTTMYLVLDRLTDSPVPGWDSFITSLSIVATWMLARKIYEHWFLWLVVNTVSAILFYYRGLYPTMILYIIYGIMSVSGLQVWKKDIISK